MTFLSAHTYMIKKIGSILYLVWNSARKAEFLMIRIFHNATPRRALFSLQFQILCVMNSHMCDSIYVVRFKKPSCKKDLRLNRMWGVGEYGIFLSIALYEIFMFVTDRMEKLEPTKKTEKKSASNTVSIFYVLLK